MLKIIPIIRRAMKANKQTNGIKCVWKGVRIANSFGEAVQALSEWDVSNEKEKEGQQKNIPGTEMNRNQVSQQRHIFLVQGIEKGCGWNRVGD